MKTCEYGRYKAEYDGEYPNACGGRLKVWNNDILVYSKEYCCYSTGRAFVDHNDEGIVDYGKLEWDDEYIFANNPGIVNVVKKVLSGIDVCCGGCI
jgi:hypothetical protein